jgi:DNA-binding LytR/AlgR family response regulator
MTAPTAVIADDERLMREQLRARLAEVWPELIVVGEAKNGAEAVELVGRHRPDFVFLDIRMPVKTGLEAAAELAGSCRIVFVTAYDVHAVEAFEHGAIDYVLKPADVQRLTVTVRRLKERLVQAGTPDMATVLARLDAVASALGGGRTPGFLKWVQVGLGQQLRVLPVSEIVFMQAQDKYTAVATAQDMALVRKPIREFIEELDPDQFWQIHRGTLVAVREIASVLRNGERLTIALRSRPERLEVSRGFAGRFRQM